MPVVHPLERQIEELVKALQANAAREDTRVSLRDHVEALIRLAAAQQEVRNVELDKAVKIAETSIRERLLQHNGLLDMIRSSNDEYARKDDLNAINKRVDEQGSRVYWLMGLAAAAGAAVSKFV